MPRLPLVVVVVVLFLDALGMALVIPVLPLLVAELYGTDVGGAAVVGGLLSAAFAGMLFLCGPLIGNLSDHFGRRPVLFLAIAANAVDYALLATATTVWLLFVGRILAGITGASFTVAGGYLADITPPEKRAFAFGVVGGTFSLGLVCGPALGGALAGFDLRLPFIVAGGLALANLAAIALLLPESLAPEHRRPFEFRRINPIRVFAVIAGDAVLRRLVAALLVFAIATQVFPVIWPYYTVEAFGFSPLRTGLSYAVLGLCMAAAQGLAVKPAVSAFGQARTVRYALWIGAAVLLMLGLNADDRTFLALIPLMSVCFVVAPTIQGMMSQHVGEDRQGELVGMLSSLTALSMFAGPLLMSITFDLFTRDSALLRLPGAPFILAAVLMAATLAILHRRAVSAAPAVLAPSNP